MAHSRGSRRPARCIRFRLVLAGHITHIRASRPAGRPRATIHAAAVSTLTLTEAAGRTTMTLLVQHENQADGDAHINSGIETGMQEGMDKLKQVARSLL